MFSILYIFQAIRKSNNNQKTLDFQVSNNKSSQMVVIHELKYVFSALQHFYASFGNTCYYFDTVERTILEARLNCIDNHGKLWEPKTSDRMNQIQIKGMEFATVVGGWWVGITDEQNEGHFYYYSNFENFNFAPNSAPWREDEPNGGTAENCVSMGRTKMVFLDSNVVI